MLIRSQDKADIYILENLKSIGKRTMYDREFEIKGYSICAENDRIAVYSTEAKAIKVLDMIQDTYTPSAGEVQAYIDGAIPKVVLDNRVFQMPRESEVSDE